MNRKLIPPLLLLSTVQLYFFYYLWCSCNLWYSSIPERVVFAAQKLFFSPGPFVFVFISSGILAIQALNFVVYKLKFTTLTWFIVSAVTPGLLGIMLFELFFLLAF